MARNESAIELTDAEKRNLPVGRLFVEETITECRKRGLSRVDLLALKSVARTYARPGRYQVAMKVIDIFGNDIMTIVPVTVG